MASEYYLYCPQTNEAMAMSSLSLTFHQIQLNADFWQE